MARSATPTPMRTGENHGALVVAELARPAAVQGAMLRPDSASPTWLATAPSTTDSTCHVTFTNDLLTKKNAASHRRFDFLSQLAYFTTYTCILAYSGGNGQYDYDQVTITWLEVPLPSL